MWDEVGVEIVKTGWRVFQPDLRGFGLAPTWADYPNELKVCADDIVQTMNQFGIEKAVFAGCSLGGYIVMEMLRSYPDRVAGCVFVDTKASADTPEARENRLRIAESVESAQSTEAFTRSMFPSMIAENASEAVKTQLREYLAAAPVAGVAALQRAMADRPDSHEVIRNFPGPVLSIRGEQDGIASAIDHEKIVKAARDAIHVEIENCGHLAPLEKPQEVAAAINSLLSLLVRGSC